MNRLIQHAVRIVLLCCWMSGSIWAQSEASPNALPPTNNASETGIPANHLSLLQNAPEIVHHDFDPLSGEMGADMAASTVEHVLTPLTTNFVGTWEITSIALVAKTTAPEPGTTAMSQAAILQDVQEMMVLQGGEISIQSNGRFVWTQNMMPTTGEMYLSGNHQLLLKQDNNPCADCDPFTEVQLLQQSDASIQLGLDLQDSDKPFYLAFNLKKKTN